MRTEPLGVGQPQAVSHQANSSKGSLATGGVLAIRKWPDRHQGARFYITSHANSLSPAHKIRTAFAPNQSTSHVIFMEKHTP